MNRRDVFRFGAMGVLAVPFIAKGSVKAPPPLTPTVDGTTGLPLIKLPEGFTYKTFSWAGDTMSQIQPVPTRHDGMAVVPGSQSNEMVLLRNHENVAGVPIGIGTPSLYDGITIAPGEIESLPRGFAWGGGVTAVRLRDGDYVDTIPVLGGTVFNCAGGPTPWGTWLTCEEMVVRGSRFNLTTDDQEMRDHGYVFETPPPHVGKASTRPIKDMGCFKHEAAAVDPENGYVYLTEDNSPRSGFYRFIPNDVSSKFGSLEAGGTLAMLKVKGAENSDLRSLDAGVSFEVEWIDIANPDADPESFSAPFGLDESIAIMGAGLSGPAMQGFDAGCAQFVRGEGCWYYDGRIYFVDTAGGKANSGSIWVYEPSSDRLLQLFAARSELHADAIDNVTLNPQNGLIVACEDGGGVGELYGSRLLAIGEGNTATPIAENNIQIIEPIAGRPSVEPNDYRGQEWAGATFSFDGKTLYANIQTPGVTFAIEGPWSEFVG